MSTDRYLLITHEPGEGFTIVQGHGIPGLEELQRLVGGGWIERVPTSDDITMWCNEDGKSNGMGCNELATSVWESMFDSYGCVATGDYLVGPIVVQGPQDDEGYATSLPCEIGLQIMQYAITRQHEHIVHLLKGTQ